MRMVDVIIKKREGKKLTDEEIKFFVNGYIKGDIPDYQISALLMAIFLKGLNFYECSKLTNAMRHSGIIPDFAGLYTVDKHSTGGVGDKLSFIMAPIFAAAGGFTPMTSGRGLGHTGGTLDKLESIPGMNINLNLEEANKLLYKLGLFYIGQTGDLAPADKKIYALRDVTGTVESKELIVASILSKKFARSIVFDIKCGNGAFMKNEDEANLLANMLVNVAKLIPMQAIALITDMNQPLGHFVGNGLEIYESVEILKGKYVFDLVELSCKMAGYMMLLAKISSNIEDAIETSRKILKSGEAYKKFYEIIKAQGGDVSFIEDTKKLYKDAKILEIKAMKSGRIDRMNTYNIGIALILLGGGRNKVTDIIDHSVGFEFLKKTGDRVEKNEIIALMYHKNKNVTEAEDLILKSIDINDKETSLKDKQLKLIYNIIGTY